MIAIYNNATQLKTVAIVYKRSFHINSPALKLSNTEILVIIVLVK